VKKIKKKELKKEAEKGFESVTCVRSEELFSMQEARGATPPPPSPSYFLYWAHPPSFHLACLSAVNCKIVSILHLSVTQNHLKSVFVFLSFENLNERKKKAVSDFRRVLQLCSILSRVFVCCVFF
jgi:hypothetical protein